MTQHSKGEAIASGSLGWDESGTPGANRGYLKSGGQLVAPIWGLLCSLLWGSLSPTSGVDPAEATALSQVMADEKVKGPDEGDVGEARELHQLSIALSCAATGPLSGWLAHASTLRSLA